MKKIFLISVTFFQKVKTIVLVTALLVSIAQPASASVIIYGAQDGDDLLFSYSGTIDSSLFSITGPYPGTWNDINGYRFYAMIEPRLNLYGSSNSINDLPTISNGIVTGDVFGVQSDVVFVDANYISGSLLVGSERFLNKTIAGTFGIATHDRVWSFTNGETVTLTFDDIPAVSSVPEPASAILLLVGLVSLGVKRRRKTA